MLTVNNVDDRGCQNIEESYETLTTEEIDSMKKQTEKLLLPTNTPSNTVYTNE